MTERKIDIVNKTAYNTDDLHEFYMRASRSSYPPHRVVVGYYTPTPESKRVDPAKKKKDHIKPSPWKHVRYVRAKKGSWSKVPRLSIVRPQALYDSPLQALASVSDDEMCVPLNVLCELAEAIARYHYNDVDISPAELRSGEHYWQERWAWLLDFKLRYKFRRRKTAEERLKEMQVKLNRLSKRESDARQAARRHEKNLEQAQAEAARLDVLYWDEYEKIRKFKQKHNLEG